MHIILHPKTKSLSPSPQITTPRPQPLTPVVSSGVDFLSHPHVPIQKGTSPRTEAVVCHRVGCQAFSY